MCRLLCPQMRRLLLLLRVLLLMLLLLLGMSLKPRVWFCTLMGPMARSTIRLRRLGRSLMIRVMVDRGIL